MKNKNKQTLTFNELEFVPKSQIPNEVLDAEAALVAHPYVRWAKFIMTDDQPNGNRERTPYSEFDNIIQSGIHMPIKMGEGRIEEGHENATPIGVITNLKKEVVDGINRIVGLAAFWLRERPSDVAYVKERIDNGEGVNLSWELGAKDKVLAEDGFFDWVGLTTEAVTIVDNPAYQGRTRIIAMAANKNKKADKPTWNDKYIENLPDSSFLYITRTGDRLFPVKDDKGLYSEEKLREALEEAGKSNLPMPILKSIKKTVTTLLDKVDAGASLNDLSFGDGAVPLENTFLEENTVELEQLKQQIADLQAKLAAAEASLQEKEKAFASLETEKTEAETRLAELQAFKDEVDAEIAKAEKLEGIKDKFAEAKLNKDEAYFTENSEKLLGMDDVALEFMVQELSVFSASASLEEDEGKNRIPNVPGEQEDYDVKEIAKALKEKNKSK